MVTLYYSHQANWAIVLVLTVIAFIVLGLIGLNWSHRNDDRFFRIANGWIMKAEKGEKLPSIIDMREQLRTHMFFRRPKSVLVRSTIALIVLVAILMVWVREQLKS